MIETINFIVALVLSMGIAIYFLLILPFIPVKVKENETLRQIKKQNMRYQNILFCLIIGMMVPLMICFMNKYIIGIHFIEAFIFLIFGGTTIPMRLKEREQLVAQNETLSFIKQKSENGTLKEYITELDEKLTEGIILDNVTQISDLEVKFRTGEIFTLGITKENVMSIISKCYHIQLLQSNIRNANLKQLEEDNFKLEIETKSGNRFSTSIKKEELSNYFKLE